MTTNVAFRDYLGLFKGAKLAVFTAIALHSDENGWSYPKVSTLCHETGYCRDSVFDALDDLCRLTIGGHRVLLYHQPRQPDGAFRPNHYLIFPTPDDLALYEPDGPPPPPPAAPRVGKTPSRKNIDAVKHRRDKTSTQRRTSVEEEPILKKNQFKHTHARGGSGGARCDVGACSKFSLEECRRYAEHLRASGQGINNPGGYATSIFRTGEADPLIARFLDLRPATKASKPADLSACPDCRGTLYWYPQGPAKGVARCPHAQLFARSDSSSSGGGAVRGSGGDDDNAAGARALGAGLSTAANGGDRPPHRETLPEPLT